MRWAGKNNNFLLTFRRASNQGLKKEGFTYKPKKKSQRNPSGFRWE
jgi:hypothetical protein